MEDTKPQRPIALDVWEALKTLLAKEKSPYLNEEKFVVQRDAYTRLVDDDVAADVPFVTYEYSQLKTDESLDFGLYMFRDYFALAVGPMSFSNTYHAFAFDSTQALHISDETLLTASPEQCARNLLLAIKLLLSGQMALGCSWHNGRLMAAEAFVTGFVTKPLAIAVIPGFTLFARTTSEYTVRQNRLIPTVHVPDTFPLLPPVVNGKRVNRGRNVDSIHDLPPLNKNLYDALDQEMSLHEFAGKKPGEDIWSYFYKTIEFWLVALVTLGSIIFLQNSSMSPAIFHAEWSHLMYLAAGWLIVPFGTGLLLGWRQQKINAGKQPLSYRFELWLDAWGAPRLLLITLNLVALVPALVLPMWTLKGDTTSVVPGYTLLSQVPSLAIPLAAALLSALILIVAYRPLRKFYRATIFGLALVYSVSLLIINGLFMNTADDAPMPPDWIMWVFLGALAALPIVAATWMFIGSKQSKDV